MPNPYAPKAKRMVNVDATPEEQQKVVENIVVQNVPDGTVKEVKDWVGSDPEKAREALELEESRGEDARSTLVAYLEAIAEGTEDDSES